MECSSTCEFSVNLLLYDNRFNVHSLWLII